MMNELEILALPEGTPIIVTTEKGSIEGTLKFHKSYTKDQNIRLPKGSHPYGIKHGRKIEYHHDILNYTLIRPELSEKEQKIDKGVTLLFEIIKSQIDYHNFFNPDDRIEMYEVWQHLKSRINKKL